MAVVARIRQVPSILRATSLLTDQVGDAVYIRGNIDTFYKVARAETASLDKMPAIGVIIKKWDFTQVLVQTSGVVEGIYSGLVANQTYWVGTTGQLTPTLPPVDGTTQRAYTQVIGVALDPAVLLLRPAANIFIKRG
jgi:hypothetical protein